jgi:hypothetical protein
MKNRYGINIRKWCKEHECEVEQQIASTDDVKELHRIRFEHAKKLHWLMHERIVHVIVLFMVVLLLMFSVFLLVSAPETVPASLPMCIIVFVLTCFYVRHYFFLENTVQKWYTIDEDLTSRIKTSSKSN